MVDNEFLSGHSILFTVILRSFYSCLRLKVCVYYPFYSITTGKPVEGNATVMLTVVPAPDPRYYNNPAYPDYNPRARTVQMQRHYNYV